MKFNLFYLIAILVFTLTSCGDGGTLKVSDKTAVTTTDSQGGILLESIDAGKYTYLKMDENGTEKWLAVLKVNLEKGKKYYYGKGMEMKGFHSKELDRTFESVIFLDKVSENPTAQVATTTTETSTGERKKTESAKEDLKIEPAKGGMTIADIYAKTSELSGKKVIVKGKVMKFSPQIMGKNWIHLQDGTETDGKYDLAITTNQEVKVGDVITFEGKITLNKDFGAGYVYDLIMEEATTK